MRTFLRSPIFDVFACCNGVITGLKIWAWLWCIVSDDSSAIFCRFSCRWKAMVGSEIDANSLRWSRARAYDISQQGRPLISTIWSPRRILPSCEIRPFSSIRITSTANKWLGLVGSGIAEIYKGNIKIKLPMCEKKHKKFISAFSDIIMRSTLLPSQFPRNFSHHFSRKFFTDIHPMC